MDYKKAYAIMVGAASEALDMAESFRRQKTAPSLQDAEKALTLIEIRLTGALEICEEMYINGRDIPLAEE